MTCSIARTLDVIGDWWTPLIIRDVFVGISRFDAIQRDLGISRKVLAQRLDRLCDAGVLERVPYQDKPVRHDYRVTEKGADLALVLLALKTWGDRWAPLEEGPPMHLRHEVCGEFTDPVPHCGACGERMTAADVTMVPGPGLSDGPGTREIPAAFARLAAASG
jgi:DNA-binding HxlR family transcriptional regulator